MNAWDDLIGRYASINFELLRDQEEQAIATSLTAAGFNVVRTAPTDEAAVNMATLCQLRTAFDAISKDPWSPSPVGTQAGWNVVLDDSLPDGEIHFRPRPGQPLTSADTVPDNADKQEDTEPYGTCQCTGTDAGLELCAQCPGRADKPQDACPDICADGHMYEGGCLLPDELDGVISWSSEHGRSGWTWSCEGEDRSGGCQGWLSLGHPGSAAARRAYDRHMKRDHAGPTS